MSREKIPSLPEHDRSTIHEALRRKIADGTARVGIIGLGYVGLPLARAFTSKGIAVLGFDVDAEKVAKLERGESYIGHISADDDPHDARQGFEATDRFDRLDEPDVDHHLRPDSLTDDSRARPDLHRQFGPGHRRAGFGPASSSSWRARRIPGTTRDVVLPILEAERPEGRAGLLPRLQPRARGPGQPPASRRRPSPRSSAASTRPAWSWPRPSTDRSSSASCRSPARRSPRPARSSRTPTARSTSRWSTS